jgi:phosphatidylglycerol---prolipoprotein diacylglyceryl transferase
MHPLLFEISLGSFGAFRVSAFGALFALAAVIGVVSTARLAARAGLSSPGAQAAALSAVLSGVLGARLGYVLLHLGEMTSVGQAFSLRAGGLSGPAGLVFGALAFAWVGRRRRLPLPQLFDAAAPGFAAAVCVARLGCWLEGCDFGRSLPAAAPGWLARLGTFPRESPAWTEQVLGGALVPSAGASLPVHPSELYESVAGLVLLAFSLVLARRQRVAGTTALAVMFGYFALRVLVDESKPPSAEAWLARAVLVLLVMLAVALTVRRRRVRALRP